jgi:hypothetical protein
MKVKSERGIDLKNRAREILADTLEAAEVLQAGDWELLATLPESCRSEVAVNLAIAGDNRRELLEAIRAGRAEERRALAFLLTHMPTRDLLTLSGDFLLSEIRLALRSRHLLTINQGVPDSIFHSYVLPYAQMDEERHPWREGFQHRFLPLVHKASSVEEAVMTLNESIFDLLGVSYGENLPVLPQSPAESIEAGQGDCYSVSILLADACRAVGIPARVVCIDAWVGMPNGHAWIEVYDRGQWRVMSAYDRARLDQAWFLKRASETNPRQPRHRIYAASFARKGIYRTSVGMDVTWIDVTDRYLGKAE